VPSTIDSTDTESHHNSRIFNLTRKERSLTYAATNRDGRDGTIPFKVNPDPPASSDEEKGEEEKYRTLLPDAKTVVITFPMKLKGAPERFVRRYVKTRRVEKVAGRQRKTKVMLNADSH
jgi:hypothetical protein